MKLMLISDIHGSAAWLRRALEKADEEQPDYLIMVGDYLYHGPRNPLPDGYDPKEAIHLLNSRKERIIAVRGNCDSEVDQMMLEFPMMGDYAVVLDEGRRIFVTHGHLHSMDQLPPLKAGDVFVQGHTHVPVAEKQEGIYLVNPGSITLPKENYPPSYGILHAGKAEIKSFEGKVIKSITFDE
ncbi:phosphodiesterase [Paenibacillus sp. CAA11]|uniref:phosphodiesterase n=1 Tax=Paenibacillus sp. CAA11 TaxID=1532905 RepID=UPI000D37AD21|nr:phosphodiesterase [Paenibacillus sp. CAA11]AWB43073.1 phosphodiesterase [Paenibacillus sp. CAA11]